MSLGVYTPTLTCTALHMWRTNIIPPFVRMSRYPNDKGGVKAAPAVRRNTQTSIPVIRVSGYPASYHAVNRFAHPRYL